LYNFIIIEDERKHQQGNDIKDEKEREFRVRTGWQLAYTKN
jgi:hypothetical protein